MGVQDLETFIAARVTGLESVDRFSRQKFHTVLLLTDGLAHRVPAWHSALAEAVPSLGTNPPRSIETPRFPAARILAIANHRLIKRDRPIGFHRRPYPAPCAYP